ncbi:MAG TPA: 50S ribosome-binding GTPase, partial [Candidatus Ozemobacteraceae bacterium]|nr:50S ribosome-binding GTPase [Candidatus Ozemobacteraceae bacterium]
MTNGHDEVIDLGLLGKLLKQLEESTVGTVIAKLDPRIINELRELIRFMHRREPRIMLVGRRGAGKSSLVNAMLGVKARNVGSVTVGSLDCKWEDVGPEEKRLRVLDTKGTGQGD